MNFAQINRKTKIVENIVVADEDWVKEQTNDEYFFVEYEIEKRYGPKIGLSWSEEEGFEQYEPYPLFEIVYSPDPE